MQVNFLDENGKWQATWIISPQGATQDNDFKLIPPRAVEVILNMQRWGAIRRLFVLPELPVYPTPEPEKDKPQIREKELTSSR
jgi:hypothetical protein